MNPEVVSIQLSSLKEMCQSILISYLTKPSQQNEANLQEIKDTFFKEGIAERNPEFLIDICDYWLNQIFHRVPSNYESGKSNYGSHLIFILNLIEEYKSQVVNNPEQFKKWLNLIRYIPRDDKGFNF